MFIRTDKRAIITRRDPRAIEAHRSGGFIARDEIADGREANELRSPTFA